MKFHKAIKYMQRFPTLLFRSDSLCVEDQNLASIRYWIAEIDDDEDRARNFDTFFKAEDWEIQAGHHLSSKLKR